MVMDTRRAFITLGLVLVPLVMLPVAHADDWDRASKLTFSQSVQIPGRVLPAGTYWFVLADGVGNRNILQVFNSDRSKMPNVSNRRTARRSLSRSES
jgi:hypothetical protein